jgi:hypothetical protein
MLGFFIVIVRVDAASAAIPLLLPLKPKVSRNRFHCTYTGVAEVRFTAILDQGSEVKARIEP